MMDVKSPMGKAETFYCDCSRIRLDFLSCLGAITQDVKQVSLLIRFAVARL